jgi:hypothetical protein
MVQSGLSAEFLPSTPRPKKMATRLAVVTALTAGSLALQAGPGRRERGRFLDGRPDEHDAS